ARVRGGARAARRVPWMRRPAPRRGPAAGKTQAALFAVSFRHRDRQPEHQAKALPDEAVDIVLPLDARLRPGGETVAYRRDVVKARCPAIRTNLVVPLPHSDAATCEVPRFEDAFARDVGAD